MEVSAVDIARLGVILKALKRGKFELEGEEVLAFAQGFHWAAALADRIKAALPVVPPVPAPSIGETK